MDKPLRAFKITLVIPAIFSVLSLIYSLFSKFTGIASFAMELFSVLMGTLFYVLLFSFAVLTGINSKTSTYQKIFFLILLVVLSYVLLIWQSPQERMARFFAEIQNHRMLNNLKSGDVSFIVVDNTFLTQPEQISPIINALNNSTWYTPNHECRGKEIQMRIILQNGQVMCLNISRFCDEDSAAVLFVKPLPSGFASGGNAYVPQLPSTLEKLGYPLSPND